MTNTLWIPLLLAGLILGCTQNSEEEPAPQTEDDIGCPLEDAAASIDVTGTYDYSGDRFPYLLRGTIVFEQTGDMVKVVDTTYANANDRRLEGEARLNGNRLDITLVPQNGDTNYEAEITFLFSQDGDSFCCSFSDTNNDVGDMGSYRGTRR